jgi:hypothetical protein
LLDLLFIAGLVALLAVDPLSIIYGILSSFIAVLAIAMVASILALSSAALIALAWKDGLLGHCRTGASHSGCPGVAFFCLVAEQLEPAGLQVLVQPIFLP